MRCTSSATRRVPNRGPGRHHVLWCQSLSQTSLSFIGLGDPFAPSWGQLLDNAQGAGAPGLGARWYIAPPALCVVLAVLSFTLVGNALDDVLIPKSQTPQVTDPRDDLRQGRGTSRRRRHRRPYARATTRAPHPGARRRIAPRSRRRRPPRRGPTPSRASDRCPSWRFRRRAAAGRRRPAHALQARATAGSRRSTG